MCGIIIAFIVLAAILSSALHVSAGWGLGIVAIGFVGLVAYQVKYGKPGATQRVGKMGVMYSNICPACRKHNKSRATVCRYCRTPLVVRVTPAVPAVAVSPAAVVEAERPTMTCPDCAETILAAARRCRYCGHDFTD